MATTATLSKRQIVIIGLPGSGKSTLANKLFKEPLFSSSNAEGSAIKSKRGIIQKSDIFLEVTIIQAKTSLTQEHTKAYYRDLMPDEVSLILFVCKYPTVNQDLQYLKRAISFFDGRNGRDACIIAITFCEKLSDDEKKSKEDAFADDLEIGSRVKGTYCVGFNPDDTTNLSNSLERLWKLILQSNIVYSKQTIFDPTFRQRILCYCSIL